MEPRTDPDNLDCVVRLAPIIADEQYASEKAKEAQDEKENVTNVGILEIQAIPGRPWVQRFPSPQDLRRPQYYKDAWAQGWFVAVRFGHFVGPGALISVAYIDPDNFQTAISAGARFGYSLLFIILISNLIAIFLQVGATESFLLCLGNMLTSE